MLKHSDFGSQEGKTCLVSGSGNVAIYTIEKLQQLGANPVTISDSKGMIYDESGIDLALLKEIKEVRRESLESYAKKNQVPNTQAQEITQVTIIRFGLFLH